MFERLLDFTAQRHRLIADNVANISTPGYRQKDLSLDAFQGMLRDRIEQRATPPRGPSGSTTSILRFARPSTASSSTTGRPARWNSS